MSLKSIFYQIKKNRQSCILSLIFYQRESERLYARINVLHIYIYLLLIINYRETKAAESLQYSCRCIMYS